MTTIVLIISVVLMLSGVAILIIDAYNTRKTDYCTDETPALYIGEDNRHVGGNPVSSRFFVIGVPSFEYTYEGKKYAGRAANQFFHIYLSEDKLLVPFLPGKMYRIFVNPYDPTMFVSDGEQKMTFPRFVGCALDVVGMILLMYAYNIF